MLVLSRRANQQVVFPHLDIKVSVLQVRGRIVKIGIEAPDSIKILRNEVLQAEGFEELRNHDVQFAAGQDGGKPTSDSFDDDEHRRRNQLNLLQLRLEAIQRRIDRGDAVDAESLVAKLFEHASDFDNEIRVNRDTNAQTLDRDERIRLLIVEDSDNERNLMAYLLASQGFDVHVARDGAEALEQLRMWGTMPDFVLMDMQMPLSNGLQALHNIREDERLSTLKVFAVTGSPRVFEDEPVGRGWDGWFSKPVDVAKLVKRLRLESLQSQISTTA